MDVVNLEKELSSSYTILQNSVTLRLPPELSFFSGHFPENPILPAVAFVDISHFLIQKIFPDFKDSAIKKINVLKIKTSLAPETPCQIFFDKKDSFRFFITWSNSSGTIAELGLDY